MNNLQHTNLDYLQATCGDSVEMMRSIIKMFIDSTPETLLEMRENIVDKNWDLLKRNAHKTKSSFMMVGAKQIGDTLQVIELSSIAGNSNELGNLLSDIENKMDSIIDELKTV